jgi:hypothetical protein
MAATTGVTNNFRRDLLNGDIDFAADTFKIALYNNAGHGPNTSAYSATNESSGSGYSAGGTTLSGVSITVDASNNVAYVDWSDPSWSTATVTADECLIYDDTVTSPTANVACSVHDFNGEKSSSAGTFQILLPAAAYNTAIIRLA